jgi:hypothetical protein
LEEEESKESKTKKIKKTEKSKGKGKKKAKKGDSDSEKDATENGSEENHCPNEKELALKTCNYICWAYWYVIKRE